MRVLLILEREQEARSLQANLEPLGHTVAICSALERGADLIREWQPDLLITEDKLGREQPDVGLLLAQQCRMRNEYITGSFRTQALILTPFPDWDRIHRARRTGAHVIVKATTFDVVVRYVQTVSDNLKSDRLLGPILFGIHEFRGTGPDRSCRRCEWVGASVSYGASEADLHLTPVRTALLNALLFRRRGQSSAEIACAVNQHHLLRTLVRNRALRETAIKMEISRLRRDIGNALETIGAPYDGEHFLPSVSHGCEKYRLMGNWQLSHMQIKSEGVA